MAIPDCAPRFRDDVRGGSGSAARRLAVARLENHNLDRVCIRRAADAKRPAVGRAEVQADRRGGSIRRSSPAGALMTVSAHPLLAITK